MKHFLPLAGFTIISSMIVKLIISILAGLSAPIYLSTAERSRTSEAYVHLEAIKNAELAYYNKYFQYSSSLNNLTVDNPNNITSNYRYFNYAEFIPLIMPGDGFVASCQRNNKDNVLRRNYYIWINQDGAIWSDF